MIQVYTLYITHNNLHCIQISMSVCIIFTVYCVYIILHRFYAPTLSACTKLFALPVYNCSSSSESDYKVYTFMHINIVASLICGSIFLLAGTAESAWRVTVSCTVGSCMYGHVICIYKYICT